MVDKEDKEWAFVGMALAMQEAEENCEEKSCEPKHTSVTMPNQRKQDGNLIGTHVTKSTHGMYIHCHPHLNRQVSLGMLIPQQYQS